MQSRGIFTFLSFHITRCIRMQQLLGRSIPPPRQSSSPPAAKLQAALLPELQLSHTRSHPSPLAMLGRASLIGRSAVRTRPSAEGSQSGGGPGSRDCWKHSAHQNQQQTEKNPYKNHIWTGIRVKGLSNESYREIEIHHLIEL